MRTVHHEGSFERTRKWHTVGLPPLQTWFVVCGFILVVKPLLLLQLQSYAIAISLGTSALDEAGMRIQLLLPFWLGVCVSFTLVVLSTLTISSSASQDVPLRFTFRTESFEDAPSCVYTFGQLELTNIVSWPWVPFPASSSVSCIVLNTTTTFF